MATNCPQKTISSDVTGLAYAIEECLNQLPAAPVWKPLEPNSIDSFGGTLTTSTRTPIGSGRQRIKGDLMDLEAMAGYTSDLTSANHQDFMEGFMLATRRKQANLTNATAGASILSATANSITLSASATLAVAAGDMVMCEGFSAEMNNRVRIIDTVVGKVITFTDGDGAVAATVNAGASIVQVASTFADATTVVNAGGTYTVTGDGLGDALQHLTAGDWVYLTGLLGFTGFARLNAAPSGDSMVLSRVLGPFVGNATAAQSVTVYLSTDIRNPANQADMVYHSYQFEQTLGQDADGTQSRYVKGAMANEFTLTVPSADKVTAQFAFVACDEEARTGLEGLKPGTREALVTHPMFNASKSDNRVWLHTIGEAEPLFTYATNATVTINNNMTGVKAIGVLGNLDVNVGIFEVGGTITAYFLDVRAVKAMRANADVSGTIALVGNNTGVIFDMPLTGLSNGQTSIEPNSPVTIAIDMAAVRNDLGYTLGYAHFPYLPK